MNNRDPHAYMDSDFDPSNRGPARNTMLVSPGNATFKLVRINDGFAGETFPLAEHINTIGRIDENTILLSHKSISRNHAQIIRNEGSHRLVDLDSSNGTYCDGERVHRAYPIDLTEGSILQFGSIEFVFIGIDKEIDPKSYAQSSTRWLIFAGMGILFLLIVAGASIGFTLYQNSKIEESAARKELTVESKTQKLINIGKAQLDSGDWRGASKTFETITTLLPNNPQATQLWQRAQLELEAEQLYEKAGTAIENGDLIHARELLNSIQPDTEARKRALRQLPRVEGKLATKLILNADNLMDSGSTEDLTKAYGLLLEAAKLEPPPKRRVLKAINALRKLYRSKRMKFKPISIDTPSPPGTPGD